MNLKDTIKKMIKDSRYTQDRLCKELGYSGVGVLGTMLSRGNMTVKSLEAICSTLGYQIVLKPISGENKSERTIVLGD